MSLRGIDVHAEQQHATIHLDLGDFHSVVTHVGFDHTSYTELHCAHGRLSLPTAVLVELVARCAKILP